MPQHITTGYVTMFADDADAITVSGSTVEQLAFNMKTVIDDFSSWCQRNKLIPNTSKSVAVKFYRKWRPHNVIDIEDLHTSTEVKFLGIHLDANLNWAKQINHNWILGFFHLKVAIIDETNPYGKVTAERESLIKKQLLEELDKIIFSASSNNSKPPTFKSWTYSGEIRVVCDDDVTLEWLKEATMTIKPWEEASLAVVSVDKLPKLTKASLWIPEDVHKTTSGEKKRVLGRLKAQNPDLKVARWCTFHHEVKMNPQGHLFVFLIGDDDMAVLKKKSMRVSYAFTSLTIRATEKETEGTSEDPRSLEVEPPKVDIDPKATMGPGKEVEASEQMTVDDLTEEAPKNSEAPLAGEQMDLLR
ncbi:uncharacterized protein [Leptinotarsa decemlineata]|uniref:uncharacterized protein n=1 Tax=Leptinotarsa decemlineata TaxID=7539 RepID=UPI003D30D316